MKKVTLNLVILVFVGLLKSNAQNFGITIGGNYNYIFEIGKFSQYIQSNPPVYKDLTYYNEAKSTIGFNAGFFAKFNVNKILIQPELIYITKGFKRFNKLKPFNYISMPLLFGFKIHPKLTILAGPQIGLLMSKTPPVDKYEDNLIKTELGVLLGSTIKLSSLVGLKLRYNAGLTNTFKSPGHAGSKLMNRNIEVGFEFQLKKH
jgi:hypothetical protein